MCSRTNRCVGLSAVCLLGAVLAAGTTYAQPVNDDCAGALPVGDGKFPFDTSLATDDGGGCSWVYPKREIWFAYTAPIDGAVSVRTFGTGGDAYLGVYDDCARTTALACNDDCDDVDSMVIFPAIGGTTYYIEVGNYRDPPEPDAAGELEIGLTPQGPPIVWSGEDVTFTKPEYADPSLPVNQDNITSSVALTRQREKPLINWVYEMEWDVCAVPTGVRWARGRAADWETLDFRLGMQFIDRPPNLIWNSLVLHLIEENIYLDFRLMAWTEGYGTGHPRGGGFTYERASCPCEFAGVVDMVNSEDLLAYLALWFELDPTADYDASGGVDVMDLLGYLSCWFEVSNGAPCRFSTAG